MAGAIRHAGAHVERQQLLPGQACRERGSIDARQGAGGRIGAAGCGEAVGKRGRKPAFEHHGVMAHLAQPARHHGGTHAIGIDQHEARAAHAHVLVGGLHQLAAGRVLGAGHGAGGVFLRRAHVAQEGGAGRVP